MTKRTAPEMTDSERLSALTDLVDSSMEHTGQKLMEQHLIDLLLHIDGYFADEFTPEEIVRMKYNISMDFPIFLETCVGQLQQDIRDLRQELENLKPLYVSRGGTIEALEKDRNQIEKKLQSIIDELVRCPLAQEDSQLDEHYINLEQWFTLNEIITAKLKSGLRLTKEEISHVSYNLTRY